MSQLSPRKTEAKACCPGELVFLIVSVRNPRAPPFRPLDRMELIQDLQESERPVVLYQSRSLSRKDILRVLEIEVGRDHPDYQLQQLLRNINLEEDQHGRDLLCDTQIQEQEWDLNAVDRMIVKLRRQLHASDADGLIIIQETDEGIISLVYANVSRVLRPHAEESRQKEYDMAKRGMVPKISSPRTAYDPEREHLRAAHPQDIANIVAIAKHAVSFGPAIAVRLAPSDPTIPAPSPFTLSETGGSPFYTPNTALSRTGFNGIRGKYYNQDLD